MKLKEAIRTMKLCRSNLIALCGENPAESEPIQAYDIAIEALEKHIPKKPVYDADSFDIKPKCGACNRHFVYLSITAYCPWCGQAIDWGK